MSSLRKRIRKEMRKKRKDFRKWLSRRWKCAKVAILLTVIRWPASVPLTWKQIIPQFICNYCFAELLKKKLAIVNTEADDDENGGACIRAPPSVFEEISFSRPFATFARNHLQYRLPTARISFEFGNPQTSFLRKLIGSIMSLYKRTDHSIFVLTRKDKSRKGPSVLAASPLSRHKN